jgi:hypothetical protein
MLGMEQMYKMALDPRIFPDSRLLAVLQGHDNSLPMAVAMSAKQQRDKLEAAGKAQQAQMGAKQPSVRDQMLAKDLPPAQAGLDQLPAENMQAMGEPGMAAGGIVAFGMGGFTDPDENTEDTTDQDELDSLMARQGDLGNLGAGIMAVANPAAAPYSSIGMQDKGLGASKGSVQSLLNYIIHKESGGRDFDEKGRPLTSNKGAKFAMQVLDSTAKKPGFGIQPAKDVSPEEYNRVGRELVSALHSKYQDPKLAAMAYNWGTGNVDNWLNHGKNEKALPRETRMYVAGLAQGGIVAFKNKGKVTDDDIGATEDTEDLEYGKSMLPQGEQASSALGLPSLNASSLFERRKRVIPITSGVNPLQSALGIPQLGASSPAASATTPASTTPAPAASQNPVSAAQAQQDQDSTGPTRTDLTSSFNTPTPDAGQDMLTKYLAGLEQSRKQAPGLAMMAAGLGIAGQKSPYGLSNIGAGGLQGIQAYEQAQKQDQAGTMAALSAQAAMDRNKVYAQHYAMLGQQGQDVKYSSQLQDINTQIEKAIANNNELKANPQKAEAYRTAEFTKRLKQNPKLYSWYQEQGGSTTPSSVQLQNAPVASIGKVTLPQQ